MGAKKTVYRDGALELRKTQKNKVDEINRNARFNEKRINQGILGNINDEIDLNEILSDPNTKLEILNDSSGFSIVYKVTRNIDDYTQEFLIKVMIIIENETDVQYGLNLYNPEEDDEDEEDSGIIKDLTSLSVFESEGGLQCDAYIKTACEINDGLGNNAVCPRILNLSWYARVKSIELIESLIVIAMQKPNDEPRGNLLYSLNWFMDNLKKNNKFSIGIVAMDIVKDTVKISTIGPNHQLRYRILAKVLMLFVRLSKIHLDLSLANVLFTEKEVYVIDYGRLFLFEKLFDNNLNDPVVDVHGQYTENGFIKRYNDLKTDRYRNSFTKFLDDSYETMDGIPKDLKTLVDHLNGIRVALIDTYGDTAKIKMIKQVFSFMLITDYIYNGNGRQQNRLFDFLSNEQDVAKLDRHFIKILEQFKSISQTCGQIDNDSKVCEVNEYCDELTGICYFTYKLKKYFGLTAGGRKKSIKLRSHARHNKTSSVGKKGGRRKR